MLHCGYLVSNSSRFVVSHCGVRGGDCIIVMLVKVSDEGVEEGWFMSESWNED